MPARYLRLIMGLLVFLGLMLLVGHVHLDDSRRPAPSPEEQAAAAKARREAATAAELHRNPYRYQPARYPGCRDAQTTVQLTTLRGWREDIVRGSEFADATDRNSLQALDATRRQLDGLHVADCLARARDALYQAIYAAHGVLAAHAGDAINVFDLRDEMRGRMRPPLDTADREFALVDETLQQTGSSLP
jgi:hypothetical protein